MKAETYYPQGTFPWDYPVTFLGFSSSADSFPFARTVFSAAPRAS